MRYVLSEVGVVEGSDGWMMEEDSFQRREGVSEMTVHYCVHSHRKIALFHFHIFPYGHWPHFIGCDLYCHVPRYQNLVRGCQLILPFLVYWGGSSLGTGLNAVHRMGQ